MTIHFFHAADLHLGSPFKGLQHIPEEWKTKLSQASFDAFDRLIEDAERKQPDFIVLAGDIYDGENRNLHAQYRFQQGLIRLAKKNIPVYMIHGNHDHLAGRWTRFEYPPNVTIFAENPESHLLKVHGVTVQLSGFSYGERHIRESIIERYPERMAEADYVIGLLHGSEAAQQEHDVYAPFSIADLYKKEYDYWALGHIHKRQVLNENPPIVYSGILQGRHRKEQGEQGYMDVTLKGKHAELLFCPVSTVRFEQLTIDATGVGSMDELLESISDHLNDSKESRVIDCMLLLQKGDWLSVSSEELYTFLHEKVAELRTNDLLNRITIQWQQEMPSSFKLLLEADDIPHLPFALTSYLPEQTDWQADIKEKMQAILQERGNRE